MRHNSLVSALDKCQTFQIQRIHTRTFTMCSNKSGQTSTHIAVDIVTACASMLTGIARTFVDVDCSCNITISEKHISLLTILLHVHVFDVQISKLYTCVSYRYSTINLKAPLTLTLNAVISPLTGARIIIDAISTVSTVQARDTTAFIDISCKRTTKIVRSTNRKQLCT